MILALMLALFIAKLYIGAIFLSGKKYHFLYVPIFVIMILINSLFFWQMFECKRLKELDKVVTCKVVNRDNHQYVEVLTQEGENRIVKLSKKVDKEEVKVIVRKDSILVIRPLIEVIYQEN